MIVKVQISLFTNEDCPQVLVYNKDRSVIYSGNLDKAVAGAMEGEVKKYFKAKIVNKFIELLDEVENQNW